MTKIISFIMSLLTVMTLVCEGLPYFFRPTLEVDASISEGEISSRASGFLYGIAQNGVPDSAMVESIDISSVSQKVIDGLQHPIGDVDEAAQMLDNCDYITVYLQDCFDTWYYAWQEIDDLRKSGNYNHEEFVRNRFHPLVAESIVKLREKNYADRLVICPYNEADNAVWFGTPSEDGTWLMFDEAAKLRFYDSWKETYELIHSLYPEAVIGGPGYCDYDSYEIKHFLEYCKENNCLPDIMIYHELGENSSLFWQDHIDEFRTIEKNLGIKKMPIIITEYGTMYECGSPADMLKYIACIEKSDAYANAAYWRLANNLCDTAADNNSPNSNWWLFRWYADMEGSLLKSKIIDIFHSDFANVFKYGYDRFHYKNFNGIASLTDRKDKIEVICGGCDYTSGISFKNLNKTNLGKKVNVKIESVYFEGLSGIVNSPVKVCEYTADVVFGKLRVEIENPDPTAVYHIVITEPENKEDYFNDFLPVRYEFENGVLSGHSYTYDSAYATTGQQNGMVGGLENKGDSVTVSFNIPENGYYDLKLIFGNSNDGSSPDERTDSQAIMTLDGKTETISFPNTIKSEYTDKMTLVHYLEKGNHSLSLEHKKGTFVVDSMLVDKHKDINEITVLFDGDRTNADNKSYLAVAPYDGFFEMKSVEAEFSIDGADAYTDGNSVIYLRRGLNYIDIKTNNDTDCVITATEKKNFFATVNAEKMTLCETAFLSDGYIDGISCNGGKASFKINVPESGNYRMTVAYSNNDEGGVHSYNVDLIERYITVNDNYKLWCRNTYSWDTVKTVTMNIELSKGENEISFSNDGSFRFNNKTSYAPRIYSVTINDICE